MLLVVKIMELGSFLDHKISEILKQFEITHSQFNILRILEVKEKEYVSNISEKLVFKTPDVTRLLNRLEKKKLVDRKVCPKNRRRVEVRITEAGLDVVEKAIISIETELDVFYKNILSPGERDISLSVLNKIKKNLLNKPII